MANLNENEFVRHESCNNCGSSDANSLYSDGSYYCFSCRTYTPAEGINLNSQSPRTMTNVELRGHPQELRRRRISEPTCRKFRIHRDGDTLLFPYFTSDGVISGIKVKTNEKYLAMKEFPLIPYLVSIYSLLLVEGLLLLRVN